MENLTLNHAPDFFCKCSSCHRYRARRIHAKCDMLDTALDILEADNARLEWPVPAADLPEPPNFQSLTPTLRPCPRKWGYRMEVPSVAE